MNAGVTSIYSGLGGLVLTNIQVTTVQNWDYVHEFVEQRALCWGNCDQRPLV